MTNQSIRVKLPLTHHKKLNKDIEDRIRYQVNGIDTVSFDDQFAHVHLQENSNHSDPNNIEVIISKILEDVSFLNLEFNEKCIYENVSKYIPTNYVSKAIENGYLIELSEGTYAISGFLFNLKQYLDSQFIGVAKKFQAKHIELPSLISTKDLLASGHFETFPHHVYLSGHIDFTKEKCKIEKKSDEESLKINLDKHVTHGNYCLTPSVCYNYYKTLEGKKVNSIKDTLVTARCSCYRYELSSVAPFQRQREFEMREIIFVGNPNEVSEMRDQIMKDVWEIALSLDLKAKVKNAFDPFFSDNLGPRAAVQFNRNLKYELLAEVNGDSEIAISSFNLHGATFGKAFNIHSLENKVANSGCIGFGLERWMLALISKFGLEKDNWPQEFRQLF